MTMMMRITIRNVMLPFKMTTMKTLRLSPNRAILNINNNPLQFVRRMYHVNIVEHYENPRNVGSLDVNDSHVGTGLVGAPACGDVMKLQIRISPEDGTIIESKFKTFGLHPLPLLPNG